MAVKLTLVPDEAAASIEMRIKLIEQCERFVRETVIRYDGLKAFEAELEKRGIAAKVKTITGAR